MIFILEKKILASGEETQKENPEAGLTLIIFITFF
jgi:hypothetical protein